MIAPTLEHAVATLRRGPVRGRASGGRCRTPAIELRGLARDFGERSALRDVSLAVPSGATLAVLGRNGAGKSTLLRILATLLRPHAGEVSRARRAAAATSVRGPGRLGLLGHEPLLYRDLTRPREPPLPGSPPRRQSRRASRSCSRASSMERRADEPVRSLSRGMVQRRRRLPRRAARPRAPAARRAAREPRSGRQPSSSSR